MAMQVHRQGLTLLHEPGAGEIIPADIVFVHGLFGHPYNTWSCLATRSLLEPLTKGDGPDGDQKHVSRWAKRLFRPERRSKGQEIESKDSESSVSAASSAKQAGRPRQIFWPRDLLPAVLPAVRIFTWGYDVDVANLVGRTAQESIYEHANVLLSDLADSRTTPEEKERPIIFVAHSLGGIVVKDALGRSSGAKSYLSAIFPATFGICFLGTPHRGSEAASLGKMVVEISKLFFRYPNTQVLRALEVNSETLDRVDTTFREIISGGSINIASFRETVPSRGGVIVVQQHSYRLGLEQEITNSIPADHRNMAKFGSKDDTGFKRVAAVLKRWVESTQSPTGALKYSEKDRQACLDSLNLLEARDRIAEVERTFEGTYEWIFGKEVGFAEWLRDRNSATIFWVQGKPGSGKSTVMKFALQNPETRRLLGTCDNREWIIAGFFFDDRGSAIQKSINGLLCEILHHLFEKRRDLIDFAMPVYLGKVRYMQSSATDFGNVKWPTRDLAEVLSSITRQSAVQFNLCLFIDALDEHSGDQMKLIEVLSDLAEPRDSTSVCIKLCVASRAENIFQDAFKSCPGFAIHKHTENDIKVYAEGRIGLQLASELSQATERGLDYIINEIVERAQGVFIWVKLVVDEMVDGLCQGDSVSELRHRLSTIPSELESLYQRAFVRIQKRRLSREAAPRFNYEVFVMFQIALRCREPFPLATFMANTHLLASYGERRLSLNSRDLIPPPDPLSLTTGEMRRRLTSRCGGLLETVNLDQHGRSIGADIVQFIHQTAKEFIRDGSAMSNLTQDLQNFIIEDGYLLLLRLCILNIRQGRDLEFDDLVFYASHAEEVTGTSNAEIIDMLINVENEQSRRESAALLRKGRRIPEYLHGYFVDLPGGSKEQQQFWLLFLAVYGKLAIYLEEKLNQWGPIWQEYASRLLAVAVKDSTDNTGIIQLLLQSRVNADSSFNNETAIQQLFETITWPRTAQTSYIDSDLLAKIIVLLDYGADPNQRIVSTRQVPHGPQYWKRPVHAIIAWVSDETAACRLLEIFIDHGADLTKMDSEGNSALFHAIDRDDSAIISLLLKHGADPLHLNKRGLSAIEPTKEAFGQLKYDSDFLRFRNKCLRSDSVFRTQIDRQRRPSIIEGISKLFSAS